MIQPPRGGPSRVTTAGLILMLALSLGANALLGQRGFEDRTKIDRLQASVDQQAKELDALRGRLRGSDTDDPLTRVADAVEQLRHLKFKREVDVELVTVAELKKRVRTLFIEGSKRAEFEASADVLRAFGVVPRDYDLYRELLELYASEVAGFYDHETEKMVVAASDLKSPTPLVRYRLAHEYVHALTDQHFSLDRLDRLDEKEEDEAAFAFKALVEGDAQLVSELYVTQVLTSDEQRAFLEEVQALSDPSGDDLPPFLRKITEFPYDAGLEFVRTLHGTGRFDTVDAAYKDPPTTTEQILHPTRYLSQRDGAQGVRLPEVRATLGAGWRQIEVGEFGEFDTREILDLAGDPGLSATDAAAGASGWDGGRYIAFRKGDSVVVAALTVWDSPTQASEAERAVERWLPLRFRNRGASFDPGGTADGWTAPDGAGLVSRNADRVLWVMGSDRASVEQARKAFSGF